MLVMLLITGAISALLASARQSQDAISGQNLMQKYAQRSVDTVVDRLRGASEIISGDSAHVTAAFANGDTISYYLQSGMLKRDYYWSATGQTTSGEVISDQAAGLDFGYYVRLGNGWTPAATAVLAQAVKVSVTMAMDKNRATEASVVKLRNKSQA